MEDYKPDVVSDEKLARLKETLVESGIPIENWTGKEGTKTVENLFAEIEAGETELVTSTDGKILRVVHVVAADITYLDPATGLLYRLKEDRQVSKIDGNVKRRSNLQGAVAEKMKVGEDPQEATIAEREPRAPARG